MRGNKDVQFVGKRLDRFGDSRHRMGVAADHGGGPGVPSEMWAGPVEADGWVEWKLSRSTVKSGEIDALESELGIRLPPLFRAYFLSRFQLFREVHSAKHPRHSIFMPEVPSSGPLDPLRQTLRAWSALLDSGYAAFATWNDGWGPVCFDLDSQRKDGECPIVWMDHEVLIPLGDAGCRTRTKVLPYVKPLYKSFRELFEDLFPEKPHAP